MPEPSPFSREPSLAEDLQQIARLIEAAAQCRENDGLALLALLRLLEQLHRDIRENLFRSALPNNRQRLYGLLRDIEVNGGWPYIQRMKLQTLLLALEDTEGSEEADAAMIEDDLSGDTSVAE